MDGAYLISHRHKMDGAYLISYRVNMDGAYIWTLHFLYTLIAWFFQGILPSRLFEKMFSPETNHRVFFSYHISVEKHAEAFSWWESSLIFFYSHFSYSSHRGFPLGLFEKMFSPETNHQVFFFLSFISRETRWSLWLVGVKLGLFLKIARFSNH